MWLGNLSAGCVAGVHLVESDGDQDERADGDLQVEGVDGQQVPPLLRRPMISAPHTAPIALPRAPDRLAPPMTQAAMACSSNPVPAVGTPAPRREVNSTPPTAARTPEMTYTAVVTTATGTPASRAASGFDPTEYTYRPNTVRPRTNHAIAVITTKMISRLGIPTMVPLAMV